MREVNGAGERPKRQASKAAERRRRVAGAIAAAAIVVGCGPGGDDAAGGADDAIADARAVADDRRASSNDLHGADMRPADDDARESPEDIALDDRGPVTDAPGDDADTQPTDVNPEAGDTGGEDASGGLERTTGTATVADGLILTSADGRCTIAVPPGAVAGDVEIGIAAVPDERLPDGLRPLAHHEGLVYQLTPEGLRFAEPVRVRVEIPASQADGLFSVRMPQLVSYSAGEGLEVLTDAIFPSDTDAAVEIDADTGKVYATAELRHFSWIGVELGWAILRIEAVESPRQFETPFAPAFEVDTWGPVEMRLRRVRSHGGGGIRATAPEVSVDAAVTPGAPYRGAADFVCVQNGASASYEVSARVEIDGSAVAGHEIRLIRPRTWVIDGQLAFDGRDPFGDHDPESTPPRFAVEPRVRVRNLECAGQLEPPPEPVVRGCPIYGTYRFGQFHCPVGEVCARVGPALGDPAPRFGAGAVFTDIKGTPWLSRQRRLAFNATAQVAGAAEDFGRDEGVWVQRPLDEGELDLFLGEARPIPGMPTLVEERYLGALATEFGFDRCGGVLRAISYREVGAAEGSPQSGLFAEGPAEEADRFALRRIARQGDPVGLSIRDEALVFGAFDQAFGQQLVGHGQRAAASMRAHGAENSRIETRGVFAFSEDGARPILVEGCAVHRDEGICDATEEGVTIPVALGEPAMGAGGHVATSATIAHRSGETVLGDDANSAVVLRATDGPVEFIAREGEDAPDAFGAPGPDPFYGRAGGAFSRVAVGEDGAVAFYATVGADGAERGDGLWIARGGDLRAAATSGGRATIYGQSSRVVTVADLALAERDGFAFAGDEVVFFGRLSGDGLDGAQDAVFCSNGVRPLAALWVGMGADELDWRHEPLPADWTLRAILAVAAVGRPPRDGRPGSPRTMVAAALSWDTGAGWVTNLAVIDDVGQRSATQHARDGERVPIAPNAQSLLAGIRIPAARFSAVSLGRGSWLSDEGTLTYVGNLPELDGGAAIVTTLGF